MRQTAVSITKSESLRSPHDLCVLLYMCFFLAVMPFSAITDEMILMPTPKYKTPVTLFHKCKKWEPRKRKRVSSQHVVNSRPLLCTKCLVILNPYGYFSVIIHLSSPRVYIWSCLCRCAYICAHIYGGQKKSFKIYPKETVLLGLMLSNSTKSGSQHSQWSSCLWLPSKDNMSASLCLSFFFSNQSYGFWELKAGPYIARQAFSTQTYPWGWGRGHKCCDSLALQIQTTLKPYSVLCNKSLKCIPLSTRDFEFYSQHFRFPHLPPLCAW